MELITFYNVTQGTVIELLTLYSSILHLEKIRFFLNVRKLMPDYSVLHPRWW